MGAKTGKMRSKKGKPLSKQDWDFINAFLETGSATQAYYAAGRNGKSAQTNAARWLARPQVQRAIEDARNKAISRVAKRHEVTVESILEELEEERQLAMGATPTPQCAAAIKATELKGKSIGMFQEDFREREQMPLLMIKTGDGAVIAMAPREQAALMPPIATSPEVDEVLTDDDLL